MTQKKVAPKNHLGHEIACEMNRITILNFGSMIEE